MATAHCVDIIAVDLDGTLLSPDGSVSIANREAVARARASGVRVVVCTGRGLIEARGAIDGLLHDHAGASGKEEADPVIVAGGAITADPISGRTMHRLGLEESIVRSGVDALHEDGHAALVLKDRADAGYDYLVVAQDERHALDPVTAWWFETMGVHVRTVAHADHDEHPHLTVRLGACARAGQLASSATRLRTMLGASAVVHSYPAVVAPHHVRGEGETAMHVLEVFGARATKWHALAGLAAREGVARSRIAAIGDEVNDLEMVREAGVGVAMGNAVPVVASAARHRTRSNREDGVAHAIHQLLDSSWGADI